ncbi:MAG: hypothetical protein IJY24_05310 [Clostridia bacterium]|nr:hypothetical protein [Clostridia bacterium]
MSEKESPLATDNIEIERKFIIERPEEELLREYKFSEIIQTYLLSGPTVTHRVRQRTVDGVNTYTETKKLRIDRMSAIEDEREITRCEYEELLRLADPGATPICKRRYLIPMGELVLELDIYPRWKRTCVMEIELPSREVEVTFPSFIHIVKEVTGDKRYSNATMSRNFPEELST